ncbi:hypothetical protein BCR41DRAFT_345132 [Lobosporangium transversale]|uniref:Uncharacterized protein n=1 Tax=Lobosporangium transversale TaxID=64571 RepID=A0A1Y2H199_9FUNG|nr:hypothetical protein BCR41DRAFT_345132 [Lobosporangium transversale]ORZ28330.1 hypothetical protein BCR41DRAFT_345132 [Lobosporangium transversale]|eukprot:XP_021886015.1 hypothetical protein BCR41DRAFT_345132 [Lobosporangium transversale]
MALATRTGQQKKGRGRKNISILVGMGILKTIIMIVTFITQPAITVTPPQHRNIQVWYLDHHHPRQRHHYHHHPLDLHHHRLVTVIAIVATHLARAPLG